MSTYSVSYDFNPNDPLWVLSGNSIQQATCIQVDIKVVPTSNLVYNVLVYYIVLLECNAGTLTIKSDYAFFTFDDAVAALKASIDTAGC